MHEIKRNPFKSHLQKIKIQRNMRNLKRKTETDLKKV